MILKHIEVKNYKQHASVDKALDGHVIGVIGRNGAGKSNLLGAIHFAFSGEQPGFNKSDLLRWGETEGHVAVDFVHNGIAGRIERALQSASVVFQYGQETVRGAQKCAEKINEYLGLDRDLLRQAIFVRQAEIDGILFEDPRVRELSFQKLCGLGEASKIHKRMTEELATLAIPQNYDEQIASATAQYAGLKDRLAGLEVQLAQMVVSRQSVPDAQLLKTELQGLQQAAQLVGQLVMTSKDMAAYQAALAAAHDSLAGLGGTEVPIDQLDQQIAFLTSNIAAADEYAKLQAEWTASGNALMTLGTEPVRPQCPMTQQDVDALQTAYMTMMAEYQRYSNETKLYQDLMDLLGSQLTQGVECFVCGHTIDDPSRIAKKLADARAKLSGLQPAEAKRQHDAAVATIRNADLTYQNAVQQYRVRSSVLQSTYLKAEERLKTLPKQEASVESLRAGLQQAQQLRQAVLRGIADRSRFETIVEQTTAAIKRADGILQDTRSKLTASRPDVAGKLETRGTDAVLVETAQQIKAINEALDFSQKLDNQMSALRGMTGELTLGIQTWETTISTLTAKRDKLGGLKDALGVLTSVKDWFHYSNGPHTLAAGVLNDMTADVNNFLSQFAAPFSVIPAEEGMGFRCVFHDGRKMPDSGPPDATCLSGGEKIKLAVAFRFAAYCMFSGKIGLLSLDEPTAYLDAESVSGFCTLLEKIKEVAKAMDLQLLCATHEREVMPFFDSVIEV